jgi:hypothetical protein
MNHTTLIFTVFSLLVGVLLFGIWSNMHAYAQQSSSPTLSASSPPTGGSLSTTISPELKAKMCDPSNPSLKVVNTTESHICGIPKTVKPPSLSSATPPPTSSVSSSPSHHSDTHDEDYRRGYNEGWFGEHLILIPRRQQVQAQVQPVVDQHQVQVAALQVDVTT